MSDKMRTRWLVVLADKDGAPWEQEMVSDPEGVQPVVERWEGLQEPGDTITVYELVPVRATDRPLRVREFIPAPPSPTEAE